MFEGGGGGGRTRQKEGRFRAGRKFSLGNSARGDRFSLGERSICRAARGGGKNEPRGGGGKSIHCFEETRRARVPAHRPANGASFGGSMCHCVLPRRLRSLRFRLSLFPSFNSFPRLLSFACCALCSFRRVVHSHQYFRTHAIRRAHACADREYGMIRGGHGRCICGGSSQNTRGISGERG